VAKTIKKKKKCLIFEPALKQMTFFKKKDIFFAKKFGVIKTCLIFALL
jgi:hypothetical protein